MSIHDKHGSQKPYFSTRHTDHIIIGIPGTSRPLVSRAQHIVTLSLGVASTAIAISAAFFSFKSDDLTFPITGGIGVIIALLNETHILLSDYDQFNNTLGVVTATVSFCAGLISFQNTHV